MFVLKLWFYYVVNCLFAMFVILLDYVLGCLRLCGMFSDLGCLRSFAGWIFWILWFWFGLFYLVFMLVGVMFTSICLLLCLFSFLLDVFTVCVTFFMF